MKSVTPQQFAALEGAALIDVREPAELDEVRTAQGVPIPMSGFLDRLGELPEGPLYVLCRSGARSARVTEYLEQQGYDATNIDGGIMAWEAAGLPVLRGPVVE
ncbi:MAG TPA: rhodanese-like domain-containing protein [Pseudolysinimonas sp.]|nr:rhodanese-like domain-containing protein [Pseudolysinimonas sp.]